MKYEARSTLFLNDSVTNPTPPTAPPTNVVSIATRRIRPADIRFVVGHVQYQPSASQQILDAMIREVLLTEIFESNEHALAQKLYAREKAKELIASRLRPHFLEQAKRDAEDDIFTIRPGMRFGFFNDFQCAVLEGLHGVCRDIITESSAKKIRRTLKTLNVDLILQFGDVLKSGQSTDFVKSIKDNWKDDFKSLDFPSEFKGPLYLLLQAFVDLYVVPFWSISERPQKVR